MKRLFFGLLAWVLMWSCTVSLGDEIVIPELKIDRMEIPDCEALRLVQDMKVGWNLGNTFDAADCFWLSDEMEYESAWCGIRTSRELIRAIREAGFRTLRIPVSWHNHLSPEGKINPEWLDRVYEVAGWGYEEGLYVIVNIHHDDDPRFYYPDLEHLESSSAYIRTVWSQIAQRFADFDERVLFESVNEPRLKGTDHEWWWDPRDPDCQESMAVIVALNQVFVDTVRASGGRNAERYLLVPAYDANPEYACDPAFSLPEDPAENRIIVSAHAYTPYSFALQQPGTNAFSLKNGSQTSEVENFLQRLYERYVSQGIPVLMSEFGAMDKNNLQDRVDWVSWYVACARARGITCCWWDNHLFEGQGERFGLFSRVNCGCVCPEILEALIRYCE